MIKEEGKLKYKDKNVLVNDTGPKQTIYILKGEEYMENKKTISKGD